MRSPTTPSLLLAALLATLMPLGCPSPATDAGVPAADGGDAGQAEADAGVSPDDDAGAPDAPRMCGDVPPGVTEGRQGLTDDVVATSERLVVLMGGSVEDDPAAKRFAEAAGGGDLLVLRASGAVDTYTPWFHAELGADPALSSTATLRVDDPAAGGDAYVLCRAEAAEALWLAGGDQWDYLGGWPASLREVIGSTSERDAAVGGTSAGAMVLGEGAFDAEEGSVTSEEALEDPTSAWVSIQTPATAQPELAGVLVDTHFTERDREGRLIAFLSAFKELSGRDVVVGVGLDERAALIIDGAQAEVLGPADRHVTLYRLAVDRTSADGEPLTLTTVTRRRLGDGLTIGWPPDFGALGGETLTVTSGDIAVATGE